MISTPDLPTEETKPRVTPEEYLARERAAVYRSEYRDGEIVPMSGASFQHNLITTNINVSFNIQIGERPCSSVTSDQRVRVSAPNISYTYPDVVAFCGDPLFDDQQKDTLLNPAVIVEVLSPSTCVYDRGEKFAHCRRIDTLTDYLLIEQASVHVEHFAKQNDIQWLLTEYTGLDKTISLPSIGCTLRLSDIYKKVVFEATPPTE